MLFYHYCYCYCHWVIANGITTETQDWRAAVLPPLPISKLGHDDNKGNWKVNVVKLTQSFYNLHFYVLETLWLYGSFLPTAAMFGMRRSRLETIIPFVLTNWGVAWCRNINRISSVKIHWLLFHFEELQDSGEFRTVAVCQFRWLEISWVYTRLGEFRTVAVCQFLKSRDSGCMPVLQGLSVDQWLNVNFILQAYH